MGKLTPWRLGGSHFLGECRLSHYLYIPQVGYRNTVEMFDDPVDGSEIRRAPVEGLVVSPIIYKALYIPGCAGFLPSTVFL